MASEKKFHLKKEDLSSEKHAACIKKCKDIVDDMVMCCNTKAPCTKLSHLHCIQLNRPTLLLLEFYYCEACVQSDTRGLAEAWNKEIARATAVIESVKEVLQVNEKEEQINSLQEKISALENSVTEITSELKEATEYMHERNEKAKKDAIEMETLKSEITALRLEHENVKLSHEADDSFNINSLLEKSRLERGLASRESTHQHVSFSEPQTSHSSSTANKTLYQMYSIYPDYSRQEIQANNLLPEALRIIRENIAKVPQFKGDSAEWATFKTLFVATSERGLYRRVEDMERLRTLIQGDAKRMYNPEISSPFADPVAILKKLDEFYGLKGNPVRHHLDNINKLPKIANQYDREKTLELFTAVKQYYLLCEQHAQQSEINVESSLYIIEAKMFHDHVPFWRRWCEKRKLPVNVINLAVFLEDQLKRIDEKLVGSGSSQHVLYSVPSESSIHTSTSNQSSASAFARRKKKDKRNRKPCLICKNEHPVYRCPELIQASQQGRRELVRKFKLCENCLAHNNHNVDGCKRKNRPIKCPLDSCNIKLQHPLLHGHSNELMGSLVNINLHHVLTVNSKMTSTFYKIIPGHVVAQNGELIAITVLLDQGAGLSLAEMDLLQRGSWPYESSEVSMRWTKNIVRTEPNAATFDVEFIPQGSRFKFSLQNIIAVDSLDLPLQQQNAEEIKKEFPYLKKIPLPSYGSQKPQILLGLPHNKLIASFHAVNGETNGPTAELCKLGWTVGGTTNMNWHIEQLSDPLLVGFACVDSKVNESIDPLMDLVKYHYSLESLGIKSTKGGSSLNDLQAQKILNETLRFVPELRRFEACYLWINANCIMPNNFELAMCRLELAEKRLIKLGIDKVINEQFEKEIASGQIVEVTKEELAAQKRINFIPGFVTFNPNKIVQKPRWVHDTTAKFKGISLNSMLLKGPDNLIALPKAIFALREEAIAFTADVKSMFNQILMKREDQYVQLSLWRGCDPTKEPKIYRQTRLIFGPKCSPSIANAVRIRLATNSAARFPEAAEAALNQMYMDDVLDSEETVQKAHKVASDLVIMFDEASWPLVQFQSNSAEFLSLLPAERVSDKMVELCSGDGQENFTKVLGIFWKPSSDTFIFKLNDEKLLQKCFEGYIPTRKEVLSLVMRLYDPMGYLAHFIIHGRLILQELCRRALNWKDKIPEDLLPKWRQWIEEFKQIAELEIPRQYIARSAHNCNIQYHLFVDASTEGYGANLYIRYEFIDEILVRLLAAKARVAPLSYNSVPRLELMAALMGARLLNSALTWRRKQNPSSYTCWSDSTPVLRYIYATHIRHTQFVAPRIAEIHEKTNIQAWRYVGTKENIADLGTKWLEIDYTNPNHPWFVGPEFLSKTQEHWPKQPEGLNLPSASESQIPIEEGKVREYVLLTEPTGVINPKYAGSILSVSSKIRADWSLFTRVIAKAIRVFYPKFRKPRNSNSIDPEELIKAEQYLIREVQKACFAEDFERLTQGKSIDAGSKIKSLSPFLCKETNLIRVRTRLSTNFSYDTRCPPILPNDHELTDTIVRFYHNQHGHTGDNAIMGEIRSKVWIISCRRAVRRCRARCAYCILKRAKAHMPPMAPLPGFRQDNDKLPFFYTAVDCYGPFDTYCGKSYFKKKVWGIIFVCLITRAYYLEAIEGMDSEHVILAIEKLNARRGPIQHIYSDNGTNFVGANNIIQNEEYNEELEVKILNKYKIQWHFQPPTGPHFGGVHERAIKEVKRALHASVGKFPVRRIALETALAQIEGQMNDRPLTTISVTPDDLEPITPNLLLKGHNNHPFFVAEKIYQKDVISKSYIKQTHALVKTYMKRWLQEVLPDIARHPKNKKPGYNLKVGDYVIFCNPKKPLAEWLKGVIIETYPGSDGIVRVADIKLSDGSIEYRRPATRLAKIDVRLERAAAENEKADENCNLTAIENSNHESSPISDVQPKDILSIFNQNKNKFSENKDESTQHPNIMNHQRNTMAKMSFIYREGQKPTLTEEQQSEYHDETGERTLFLQNLPAKLGIIELNSIVSIFGTPRTLYIRKWNGVDSFSCFSTYKSSECFEEALQMSKSIVAGVTSMMAYNRIEIERPINFKHRFPYCFVRWAYIGHRDETLKIVSTRSQSEASMPIPLQTNEELLLRECDNDYKYDFQVTTFLKNVHNRMDMHNAELTTKAKFEMVPNDTAVNIEPIKLNRVPLSSVRAANSNEDPMIDLHPSLSDIEALDEEEIPERQIIHNREEKDQLKSIIVKVRASKG